MRRQYHFRKSDKGLLAWNVHRLIELTVSLKPIFLPISEVKELDENFWFGHEDDLPTCRKIAEHAKLIKLLFTAKP